MRRLVLILMTLTVAAVAAFPAPASAEIQKAVINILGGMQCSL